MGSGTLALLLVGAMAVWLAAWVWACWAWKSSHGTRRHFSELKGRTDELERRVAGVEALLVSTVGQETEAFCRAMDELMDKMDAQKEELEPAQEGPKLVLSEKYCGVFKAPKPDKRRGGKKGAGRG